MSNSEPFLRESPLPMPGLSAFEGSGRVHLVVVRTRAAQEPPAGAGPEIVARYWHPGRRAWVEQIFESLEHALHLFVDENGWILRQQQSLDRAEAHEVIFATRPGELDQPSARELLQQEVGLTPEDATEMLDRVDDRAHRHGGGG